MARGFSRQLAAQGKLDPVIGRERKEIRRRDFKCFPGEPRTNPVLIGEPGVGIRPRLWKVLAGRIVRGRRFPKVLKDKRVVSLDMGALRIAGAKFSGASSKERLKAVLKEVQSSEGQIILFIDELHTVVRCG